MNRPIQDSSTRDLILDLEDTLRVLKSNEALEASVSMVRDRLGAEVKHHLTALEGTDLIKWAFGKLEFLKGEDVLQRSRSRAEIAEAEVLVLKDKLAAADAALHAARAAHRGQYENNHRYMMDEIEKTREHSRQFAEQRDRVAANCTRVETERDLLQRFKNYVHDRLDQAKVPLNPAPNKTRETGCRIGSRIDWLLQSREPTVHQIVNALRTGVSYTISDAMIEAACASEDPAWPLDRSPEFIFAVHNAYRQALTKALEADGWTVQAAP